MIDAVLIPKKGILAQNGKRFPFLKKKKKKR